MPSFNRVAALCTAIMVAAIMLTGALSQSYAQQTGSIRLQIVKAGFIVGVGGGSGTLNFQGKEYRLSIGGINVGTIGASAVDLVGTAENLRTAADIVGIYSQGSAALAIVGGGRVATLQNANGVVIKVSGPEVGLEASLSLSGMTISMQ
jgi:type V secretory pathway adhesin AidA